MAPLRLLSSNLFSSMTSSYPHSVSITRDDSSEVSSWRLHLNGLLPILGAYFVLALYGIDRQSLWEDEYLSVRRVVSSIPIWKDGHGFVYFALLRWWVNLGFSETVLRSLSVLIGGSAVCLLYALASAMFNRRAAVIATALFATSPYLIWYSQEARYITLTVTSTLLMMYAFYRLLSSGTVKWYLAYCCTGLLAFFTFLSTLMLPIAQGLYLLLSPRHRQILPRWIVCQLVVLVLFGWWFVAGTGFWQAFVEALTSEDQTVINNRSFLPFTGKFNNVRPAVIPYSFFALSTGFSLGPAPRELHADQTFAPLLPYLPMFLSLGILFGGLLVAGLLALRRQRKSAMLLILWAGIPIVGVFAIARIMNIYYDVRYIAMVLPAYVLLLAAGILGFRRSWVQMSLLGTVLVVHGVALTNYYFNPRYAREDTRAAAQYLKSAAGPQDVILVVGTLSSLPHYYTGNLPLVDFGAMEEASRALSERLKEVGSNYRRLWLVQIRPWQVDRSGRVKATLDDTYGSVEQRHFPGVDIYSYPISQ